MEGNQSEVARLRKQIEMEYAAGRRAMSGLSWGTSKHRIISANMERIGAYQSQLASLIGEQESMLYLCEVFDQ